MLAFVAQAIFCFILWLLLTFNGSMWGADELVAGAIMAIVAGYISRRFFTRGNWAYVIPYLPRFFFEMAKANFDVAYRVLTGRIRPGIVRISPGLVTDVAVTVLANSITLTPGTLTVDVDDERNLYVHWINVRDDVLERLPQDCRAICSTFPVWARRIGT
jgi:multicomponent Na+:H+ antiporter subunit E